MRSLSLDPIEKLTHLRATAAAEVADLRIGKRLDARCPVGRSDEKATARGCGRHLLAHVVVETFYFHIPMKTLFSLPLNFPKKVIIQTTF